MKITKIEPQKKRAARLNIYADGEFLIGVAADTLLRFGLRTGDDISPATVRALERAEELFGARGAALRLLAVRQRTVREIRDALREKEFADDIAAEIIASLSEARLLDDAAFARAYIRNALALRPAGVVLLRRKLLLLGVDRNVADEALKETLQTVSQPEAAAGAARKFLARKRRAHGADARLREQLVQFLMRRGYTWEVVEEAVRSVLKGTSGDGEQL